jgi:hypothetical protein
MNLRQLRKTTGAASGVVFAPNDATVLYAALSASCSEASSMATRSDTSQGRVVACGHRWSNAQRAVDLH